MIRTAIVAYGFSAQTFHIPYLQIEPNFLWSHMVTSKPEAFALNHPDISVVPVLADLAFDRLDLVVITSPNHAHFEQAKYCLEQGCHVIVEKPFVLSVEQAEALKAVAQRWQRQLIVFQNRRWDGDFLTIQGLIDNRAVGQVKRLVSRFDRFRPEVRSRWREQRGQGTGITWDLAPHLIDQAIALFGRPDTLMANIRCLRDDAEVDDNFEIWLDYERVQVVLGSSSFSAGPNQRFALEGSAGSFVKFGLDVQEGALKLGQDILDERWGQESDEYWGILYQAHQSKVVTTKPGNYGAFWHQVALCLEEGAQSPVPIDDAILGIRLLALAQQSSQQGRRLSLADDDHTENA
ncbi:Gfo/Idh/MocA family oxidoreductase [Reinekea sp.]|jgi:predicted dehydrogenase|uniref:Gfo/Idh/MocA family oxidoreductase n=1 Tax=Reinekea sp. TaxID=1970455 RepID=UPI002A7F4C9E|nr:Gfo/Idh/MocA family oxidoreductase [Reinekea sp.]